MMGHVRSAWAVVVALEAGGCGGAPAPSRVALEEAWNAANARATTAGRELVVQAGAATAEMRRADAESRIDVADDWATAARLYLDASQLEVRRDADDTLRAAELARATLLDAESSADERAAETLRDAARLARAREEAREGARRALAAIANARRRPRSDADDRAAVAVLTSRAELVRAAAIAISPTPLDESAVAASLAVATDLARPLPDRVDAAFGAMSAAYDLLAIARAGDAPTAEEVASFRELADDLGLPVVALDRGLALVVARLARGVPSRAMLLGIATIIRAHPHGTVVIEITAPSRTVGERRARDVVAALEAAGAPRARITTIVDVGADGLRAVFPSYRELPTTSAASEAIRRGE